MLDEVYLPREDSLLLRCVVERASAESALEIGCGAGFVLDALARVSSLAVGSDLSYAALVSARGRLKGRGFFVCCSSAEAFRDSTLDLVVFNPPYLPSSSIEDKTVDGGKGGIEVTLAWLRECRRVLKRGGRIFFVSSSQADQKALIDGILSLGLRVEGIVAKERLFYEELYVYELSRI